MLCYEMLHMFDTMRFEECELALVEVSGGMSAGARPICDAVL
jgi:hypothetical protein